MLQYAHLSIGLVEAGLQAARINAGDYIALCDLGTDKDIKLLDNAGHLRAYAHLGADTQADDPRRKDGRCNQTGFGLSVTVDDQGVLVAT